MMQRVIVVGVTGSGKSTLAARLAKIWRLEHVELDTLFWQNDWTAVDLETFRERVQARLDPQGKWIADGNYSKIRDISWSRADGLIWLDYPLVVTFYQLLKRTFSRIIRQEVLWAGNRETLQKTFFSRDSILLWAIKTYPLQKKVYAQLLSSPEFAHLQLVRLTSPREKDLWLRRIEQTNQKQEEINAKSTQCKD